MRLNLDIGEVIDLVFAIEGTKRMKQKGFKEAKEFIKNMVDGYTISEPGTHVGIVEYSDEPSVKLRLRDRFDDKAIKVFVNGMKPSAGESANLDRALEKAVDKTFSVSLGGRPWAKKILVVIAASNATGKEALKKAAKPLKERGVRVYVLPVGDEADPNTLVVLVPDETKVPKKKKIAKLPDHAKPLSETVNNDLAKSKWKVPRFEYTTRGFFIFFIMIEW